MGRVVVAGLICLDIIPDLPGEAASLRFEPGSLTHVGPLSLSTGGAVSNTGTSLHRLGVDVSLVARTGDDDAGRIVRDLIAGVNAKLSEGIKIEPSQQTSYSIALAPSHADRMFLHFPGANDSFRSADVPDFLLKGAHILHFGYPPAMRSTYEDGGEDLLRLFRRAQSLGVSTSLDMCFPDRSGAAGRADWLGFLERVLPAVDFFLPSLDEITIMLDPASRQDGSSTPSSGPQQIARRMLAMGTKVVALKCGDRGMYLRTAPASEIRGLAERLGLDESSWGSRELVHPAFEVDVKGTTGAGDATIAGFLAAMLRGTGPEAALVMACAAGAASVEAVDATSGVCEWRVLEERIRRGWKKRQPGVHVLTTPPGPS